MQTYVHPRPHNYIYEYAHTLIINNTTSIAGINKICIKVLDNLKYHNVDTCLKCVSNNENIPIYPIYTHKHTYIYMPINIYKIET